MTVDAFIEAFEAKTGYEVLPYQRRYIEALLADDGSAAPRESAVRFSRYGDSSRAILDYYFDEVIEGDA